MPAVAFSSLALAQERAQLRQDVVDRLGERVEEGEDLDPSRGAVLEACEVGFVQGGELLGGGEGLAEGFGELDEGAELFGVGELGLGRGVGLRGG
jgi:hypothetical protein